MRIAVPAESQPNEFRVAVTPEIVKKYIATNCDVVVQRVLVMRHAIMMRTMSMLALQWLRISLHVVLRPIWY